MSLRSCKTCGVYVTANNPHDEDECRRERQAEINIRGMAKLREAYESSQTRQAMQDAINREEATP